MQQEMRRKDRQLDDAMTEEILKIGMYGVLSMKDKTGHAYGVPMSYVYSDGQIYFHWAAEGKKLDSIREDQKVSFCVVEGARILPAKFSMGYKSAIVSGEVRNVEDEGEKRNALLLFVKKYSPDYIKEGEKYAISSGARTAVIRLEVDHLSGKANQASDDS